MSKDVMVAKAIAKQLKYEGRWPPNDLNKSMGADYMYSDGPISSIDSFLNGVRIQLFDGVPRYYFQFDRSFARKALAKTVASLTGSILRKTSDKMPDEWTDP